MKLLVRDKFPKMNVVTTKGKMNLPDDFYGKWFVFFSHPSDFTPVCTTEFVAFQEMIEKFEMLNTELVGLSVDTIEEHKNWILWIKENLNVEIKFPIIDDSNKEISRRLGMIRDEQKDTTTARSVVIVDFKGTVRTILEYPKEIGRNIDEIIRIVKSLQIASEKHLFTPANWPNNKIIGNKVLIGSSEEVTEKRIKDENICKLSSWFMYKSLDD
ncbi:peroxiredoxin [Clostridium senegalense]